MEIEISRDKLVLAAGQSIKEKNYWLNKLAGELVKTHFPNDYGEKRLGKKNPEPMKSLQFTFPTPLYEKVMKLSGGNDVKLHMILVTGMFMLLHKYTGNTDIMIGSPIFKQEIEGEFINTVLVFRNETAAHMSFKEVLLEVRETIIEATENQNYPLEVLLEDLNMPIIEDEFPLFDTVLLFENLQDRNYLKGVNYNMLFSFSITANDIDGVVEFNPFLYREDTTRRIVDHYLSILDQVLTEMDLPLYKVDLLSDQEKQQLLFDFNNTEIDYPGEKLLHQLFEEQAERIPDSIAVIGESLELNVFMLLTYGDLEKRSNQLANLLREKGAEADTIVALMMEPSIEMMISILGILKSGGAYLPIDPDCPYERVDYMLNESGAKILINKSEIRNPKFETNPNDQKINVQNKNVGDLIVLNFDNLNFEFVSNFDIRASNFNSSNLAYIIYTSGTTGKPKGVMVEHRNVVAYMQAFLHYFHIDATDTVIQLASYCFDVFVEEVFPVLCRGGRLVIPGRKEIVEMENLARLIAEYHVTMIDCTPLLLNEFDRLHADTDGAALEFVRTFISGGDVLKQGYVEHLLKTGKVYNTYGPTESTVCAAYYHYTGYSGVGQLNSIPIGKPIANYKIYILDEYSNPEPLGVAGELCVSSPGVARGYLNRPELTAEKFKKYSSSRTNRTNIIYRTGDLARWLGSGDIEFLGRIDQQVKIRGYRIELREIEGQLVKHELVDKAVVIDRQEADGEKYLSAYIVAREPFDLSILRNYLSQLLPDYMIPAYFTPVEQIPVTPNGKIDRNALPKPYIKASKTYIPPGNKIEEKLVAIWGEILNLNKEAISVDSDFFELGGHSLKATVMVSRIHKELDIKLPVLEVFKNQSIRKLSQYINQAKHTENKFTGIEPAEKKEYYVLSSVQRRLYFIFSLEENSTVYHMTNIIPLKDEVDKERLEQIFKYLIKRHESFRTSFHMINQEPVQRVHEELEFKIEILGVRDQGTMISGFIRPFDLSHAPLFRVGLIKTQEDKYLLIVDMHHIITDGLSNDILAKEFLALLAGQELPILRLQYKDFAIWENTDARKESRKKQEAYWLTEFTGEIPLLSLPLDHDRPEVYSFKGDQHVFAINPELTAKIKKLTGQLSVTTMMIMFSAYNILLSKYSGQEEFVVGTVSAGRRHVDLENIIGFFVNMLAIKTRPTQNKTFREYIIEVKEKTLNAYENQDYPFEELVERLGLPRQPGRQPLVDTVFAFNEASAAGLQESQSQQSAAGESHFDLMIYITALKNSMSALFEFSTDLFAKATIEEFSNSYLEILDQVAESCDIKLNHIKVTLPSHLMAVRSTPIRDDTDAWEL